MESCHGHTSRTQHFAKLGEKFSGSEKLQLGSQSSAQPLGFCARFLQQVFYYADSSAEPSCRIPKVPQNSGGGASGSLEPSFEDRPFLPKSKRDLSEEYLWKFGNHSAPPNCCDVSRRRNFSSAELESGNAPSRPQPQYWIKFLDSWVQEWYLLLGCGLAPLILRVQLLPAVALDANCSRKDWAASASQP